MRPIEIVVQRIRMVFEHARFRCWYCGSPTNMPSHFIHDGKKKVGVTPAGCLVCTQINPRWPIVYKLKEAPKDVLAEARADAAR